LAADSVSRGLVRRLLITAGLPNASITAYIASPQAKPCGVRALAGQLLDAAGVPWTEIFVGGGVAAVAAAVMAGLGVAALAPRMLPFGAVDVGPKLGLPDLPRLPVLLHSRVKDGRPRNALAALSAAFRSAVRG